MKPELLAPVGSFESLQAAIFAGCDSIYFGIAQLNMRARSSINFSFEDMQEIVKISHQAGVKAYLTLNTLLYDHDLKLMKMIIDLAQKAKVDAVIMADTAAITYAHSVGLPVHISTQLSISNIESVKFWARYADVMVLARELDLKMIKRISEKIEEEKITGPANNLIKIEAFAHGALCIAISGRCGMSLFTDNSSANRGACKQNCRRSYVVTDKISGAQLEIDNEYIMSPNDILTIDFLDEFIGAGVQVLKIEGRGRSPDYVDMVIRNYRAAIDAVFEGSFTPKRAKEWKEQLGKVYNRGFSDGYYLGKKQGWSIGNGSQAKEEKEYVGYVEKYFPRAEVAQIRLQAKRITFGDKALFTGNTTGVLRFEVNGLRNESKAEINSASRGEIITLAVPARVRPKDKLYILKARG